jgi:signal transduction histidine kinase
LPSITNDLTKIRQSLFNLLSNAAKFTENGLILVSVGLDKDGSVVEFTVKDQGIGLSTEQIGRIFEPFAQAESSTSKNFGGTGLGLSISREFCRMMGGDLVAESVPGKGSTFKMTVLLDGAMLA